MLNYQSVTKINKAINLILAIIIVIMQVCGIMVLCGVLVDFGYIYQNEIVLALLLPSNLIFYYLARYYQEVPPRFERWLLIALILSGIAVAEFFYFADVTKHLLRALASLANIILMLNFNTYFKVMTWALFRQDKSKIETDK